MKKCERRLAASLIFITLHKTTFLRQTLLRFKFALVQVDCACVCLFLLQDLCLCEQRAHGTHELYYYKTLETEAKSRNKKAKKKSIEKPTKQTALNDGID